MSELKEETRTWMRSLHLPVELSEFQNGYVFGEILGRYGLRGSRQFSNKPDLACVFQNYKATRDAVKENFGIQISLDNLIYRAKEIVEILHENCLRLEQRRKFSNTVGSNPSNKDPFATVRKDITTQLINKPLHLPKKIQEIQEKLHKFKEVKARHELLALETRKQQIDENQRLIQQHRDYEMSKIRNNHEFIKQQDTRIYEGWTRTEQIKLSRIDRENKHQQFMNSKKLMHLKSLREQDERDFREGLETFSNNCLKLGIDLVHDPDKPKKILQKTFNQVAFLERIKEKSDKEELARKEKVKRENNTLIEQQQAQKKAQKIFGQQALVQRYFKLSKQESKGSSSFRDKSEKEAFQFDMRKKKAQINSKVEYKIQFDQKKEIERQQQMRQKRISYMEANLERKIAKREKHTLIAQEMLASILDLTEECFSQQKKNNTIDIPYKFWLGLMDKFIDNKPYNQNQSISAPKLKRLAITNSEKNIAENELNQYLSLTKNWRPLNNPSLGNGALKSQEISTILEKIINYVYPEIPLPPASNLPLYLPLKISLMGSALGGKKTQAQKLCTKYGLVYIDPIEIVREAITLATPPPVIQDKKGAKKESKKTQQQKPEKILLKEFGTRIKDQVRSLDEIPYEILLEAFSFKLKENFVKKSEEEVLEEFREAQKKQQEKYAQLIKQLQEAAKKQKKDAKKPTDNEQPIKPNKNPYTKGFIVVGLPNTLKQAQLFEKVIGGYISPEERVNQEAVKEMEYYSLIVKFSPKRIQNTLKPRTLDYLLFFDTKQEILEFRNQGRKLDPVTNTIYHISLNPPPTDIKGLNERLIDVQQIVIKKIDHHDLKHYYEKTGIQEIKFHSFQLINSNQTIPVVFKEIETKIEGLLDYKTKLYKQGKKIPNISNSNLHSSQSSNQQKTLHFTNVNSARTLLNKFKQLRFNYTEELQEYLLKIKQCRGYFLTQLEGVQNNFLDILLRPDDKMIKILNFQETYNKLLSEKEGLVQIEQAKAHLLEKLDKLYDGLWDSINEKKNEAVAERQMLLKSTWLEKMCEAISINLERILQIQLNRVTEILEFCISIKLSKLNRDILDSFEHLMIDGTDTEGKLPLNLSTDRNQFPRITQLKKNAENQIKQLRNWVKYKKEKAGVIESLQEIDLMIEAVLTEESKKFLMRMDQLVQQCISRIKEYRCLFRGVVNRMDDWIIFGIKKENDSAYTSIKQIKKYINEAKKSNFKETVSKEIHEIYTPFNKISEVHLPLPASDKHSVPIEEIRLLVEQLKTITNQNKISFELFRQYYQRRIKAKLFCENLIAINFDYLQQYLVQDGRLDFYQIATVFILYPFKVPLDEDIETYENSLKKVQISHLTIDTFSEIPAFFDQQDQIGRIKGLKYLLFDTYRINSTSIDVSCLLQTLRQLNRMQVQQFRYIVQNRL